MCAPSVPESWRRWGALGWSSVSGASRAVVLLHPHSGDARVMGTARYPRPRGRCFQRCNLVPAVAEHPQFLCGGTGKLSYTTQCLKPAPHSTSRMDPRRCKAPWPSVAGPLGVTVSHAPALARLFLRPQRAQVGWSWSAAGATPPPSLWGPSSFKIRVALEQQQ